MAWLLLLLLLACSDDELAKPTTWCVIRVPGDVVTISSGLAIAKMEDCIDLALGTYEKGNSLVVAAVTKGRTTGRTRTSALRATRGTL